MYLEPTLINGHDALRLSLRIGCGDADYALKNISRFVADMRTGTYESYGKNSRSPTLRTCSTPSR